MEETKEAMISFEVWTLILTLMIVAVGKCWWMLLVIMNDRCGICFWVYLPYAFNSIQFNFNFISLFPRRIRVEENLVDIFREAEAGGEKGAKRLVINLVVLQATRATTVMWLHHRIHTFYIYTSHTFKARKLGRGVLVEVGRCVKSRLPTIVKLDIMKKKGYY